MKTFFLLFFWSIFGMTMAKTPTCKNILDSNAVLKLVKQKGLLLKTYDSPEDQLDINHPPKITFDAIKCQWMVVSAKYTTTKKGKCKYTNGCTIATELLVTIDAKTAKILSKKKTQKTYPNYE
jgi:hypothetical protein